MNKEAHIEDLNTPWFNLCACHLCSVQRRLERVTNALQGIKKPTFHFGFSDPKQWTDDIARKQHKTHQHQETMTNNQQLRATTTLLLTGHRCYCNPNTPQLICFSCWEAEAIQNNHLLSYPNASNCWFEPVPNTPSLDVVDPAVHHNSYSVAAFVDTSKHPKH